MEGARQTALAIPLATIIGLGLAHAGGISDDVVKIGVLTDMSGQFSHEFRRGLGHGYQVGSGRLRR